MSPIKKYGLLQNGCIPRILIQDGLELVHGLQHKQLTCRFMLNKVEVTLEAVVEELHEVEIAKTEIIWQTLI